MHDASESTHEVLDPVCGMRFEESQSAATYRYEDKTYHFCAFGCRDAFAADPERYLDEEETDEP
jgi:YHS domain-containing protein